MGPKRSRVPYFAMFSRHPFFRGVALVSFRRIAERAIKKVTDQPDEFLLLVELHGRVPEPTPTQVLQQTLLGQNQSPRDLFKRNTLRESALESLDRTSPKATGRGCGESHNSD